MRIEMGRISKEAAQEKVARKPNVYDIQIKDEMKSKHGGEEEVIPHQRKIFEFTQGHYNEETTPLQETDTGGLDRKKVVTDPEKPETKAIRVPPIIEDSSLDAEERTQNQDVLEPFKCWSEGKDFNTSNVQESESRSKNADVKLWERKGSNKNEQTPKRITLQISSLSRGKTLTFLEAEKAKVIREIKEAREKRLVGAKDTREMVGTRAKTCKELDHTKELTWCSVPEDKEGKALRFDRDRSAEPMDPEQGGRGLMVREQERAKDWAAEVRVKRRTGDETFSQELTSLAMSGGKIKLKGEKEQRPLGENRVQPEAKATLGAEQFSYGVVLSGQVPGTREQTNATGKKPASIRPMFETVKRNDRRATEHCKEAKGETTTLTSHPPSSNDSKNYYISCKGDKWAGTYGVHAGGAAEIYKGRASQPGEGQEEEKELQKRAIFHLEALRRIEETYKSRINRERNYNLRTKHPNELQLHHSEYRDNSFYLGVPEPQKYKVRKLQKKGQGGLNALLAPVFEEEMQRQWQNSGENSPINAYTEKQVLKIRRMKKARLRAAEDQIAAIKASAQQRRSQLKNTGDKVAKGRAMQAVNRKEKGVNGECLAQKENLSTKLSQERLFTNTPSKRFKTPEQPINRIKEVNERTRAEEEREAERRRRAKLKEEETRARLKRAGPDRASIELYGRLNRNQRIEKLGLRSKLNDRFKSPSDASHIFSESNRLKHRQFSTPNSRFKSPLDRSQGINGSYKSKHPQFSPKAVNSRFKSPLTSPRKVMKTTALEHFANWEKVSRTAQRSRSLSKERNRERRVTINEDQLQNNGERENSELRKGTGASGRWCTEDHHSQTPQKNESSETMPRNDAIPDHYNSVDQDCTCDLKDKKEKKAKPRLKALEEKTLEIAKGAYKRENRQSLSWLGKLYNTITSFS